MFRCSSLKKKRDSLLLIFFLSSVFTSCNSSDRIEVTKSNPEIRSDVPSSSLPDGFLNFKMLTPDDGMPENSAFSVVEDERGYVWIVGQAGAAKFSNNSFIPYMHRDNDSTSLYEGMYKMKIDVQGDLVLWGARGVCTYDPDKDRFVRKPNPIFNDSTEISTALTIDNSIFTLTGEYGQYTLQCARDEGVYIADQPLFDVISWKIYESGESIYLTLTDKMSLNLFQLSLTEDFRIEMAFLSQVRFEDDQLPQPSMDLFSSKPGEMLCWNGEKFLHFQEGEVKPIRIRLDNPEQVRQLEFVPTKDSSTVYMIVNYEDSVAAAYSMTRDFNDVKKLFELEKTVFWRATTDNKDGLSCLRNLKNYKSTEDEFIHYNVETKQLSTHKTSLKSQLGWRLERVQSMFYDQADNLWIGTWNSGLFLFTNQDQGFMKTTFLTRAKEEKIPYYPIYAKEDTVYLVDKNGGIHVPLKQKSYEPPESEKYEIRILGMEQYGDKIYMGAGAGGILVFDLVDDSYELIRINEVEGQPKFSTTHVLIDSKERLWGISHQGAYLIEPSPTGQKYDPDNMIPYVNDGENHIMMGSNRVETIFEFDEEIYCVSQNSGGIVKFNEETQEFDELIFRTERNWRVPIKFGETIWFASFANGVLEFDLRNRKVVQEFKSSNGKLPSSWIRNAAFIDEKEFIFRGEKDTWYSFNIEEDQLKEFERYDEYEWYFANWKPLVLSDGTQLFPGTDCIYQYNHTHRADVNHSNIIFSTIEINGEDARNLCETPIEYIEEIKLTYDQNDLRINFADQLPQDSYSMTYEYMLEGIDKDWRQTYGVMVANYPELPSGEYQFMVRMVSKDGSLQSEAKTLDIKITAPWWLTIYAFIGYILVLTIVVYRLVKVRTKQLEKKQLELEEIIQEKTADIRDQKHQIEEKQKEILDSISYAKRIQGAILPADDLMNNKLSEHFVLYKPKDIVAGDFYWMEPINDGYLIAAADCTGHGVPGAMVSVICNGALNRSVREFGLLEPGKILDQARKIVIEEFDKSKEDVKDGMDIALCKIQGNEISFAGAHNALWILRDEEVIITKGDKQPIGQFESSEPFTTHKTTIQPGDIVYLFTDGYVDQFGGEKGKKLKTKAFRELLLSLKDFSMTEQRMKIDSAFEKWRGSLEQVDDVCVIGIRF